MAAGTRGQLKQKKQGQNIEAVHAHVSTTFWSMKQLMEMK